VKKLRPLALSRSELNGRHWASQAISAPSYFQLPTQSLSVLQQPLKSPSLRTAISPTRSYRILIQGLAMPASFDKLGGSGARLSSPGIAHCIHVSSFRAPPAVRSPYGRPNLLILGGTSVERM